MEPEDREYKNLLHFFHSYLNGSVRPGALESMVRDVISQLLFTLARYEDFVHGAIEPENVFVAESEKS